MFSITPALCWSWAQWGFSPTRLSTNWAHDVFNDVIGFSFALSAIGLAVVFVGVYLERRRGAICAYLDAHLPEFVRALRPRRARLA
jgi:hypothetical protein